MARLNVRDRVQGGFWRTLEAVGVKNARSRWEAQSPFLQRAVPPLVIAALVLVIAWAAGVPPHPTLLALLAVVYALYLLPRRASADRFAADHAGDCPRLPDPVGERAQRNERVVRDSRLQGLPEHGHDGRDRHLRDDGDRAEHGRRLRGPARSRLCRLLRDRRLHGGMVRVSALQLGSTSSSARSACQAGIGGIHISIWLVVLIAAIITAVAGVLIGLPTLRLRGDYLAIVTLGFGEIIHQAALNGDADGISALLDTKTDFNLTNGAFGINPVDPPGFGGLAVGQSRIARGLHRRERLVRELRQPHLLVCDRAPADHGLLQPPAARLAAGPRLDRDPRGRGCRRRDGDPADADEDLGLRERRVLRRHRRSLVRLLQAGRLSRRLPLQLLDLHPLHGHPRRDGQRVGRDRRRRVPHVPRQGRALERRRVVQRAGLRRLRSATRSRRTRRSRSAPAA